MSMIVHAPIRRSSSCTSSGPHLKLFVAREQSGTERVVYAEADKGAVDYLFSLLSWRLPISTVIDVLTRDPMVGCLRNLYRSVQTLRGSYFCHHEARAALLRPAASSNGRSSTSRRGFVIGGVRYMVRDNLNITPPYTIDRPIIREMIVPLGDNEGDQILRRSLVSQTVLTDVFLQARTSRRASIPT